ncbi:MAG TPA: UDP-N-acetylmuramoyl-L-alanine--D-glutamate ligase, partial [Jatrophihabitans sp.]|nr:UDP-N-acetylmuramoyl-L-alanine--D-glutamate ligase [Jatrophihabitans sp.]
DFAGRTVLVAGTGLAGRTAVQALLELGAHPLVCSDRPLEAPLPDGVPFLGALDRLPEPAGLPALAAVVASPGLPPSHPLLVDALRRGVPVLGELEFAWRIRQNQATRWLLVTGTNGKTTTVRMLESILLAAGRSALAVGNVGVPVIEAVRAAPGYEVLAVEASSFQLHFSGSIRPWAGALLNLAEDHLDWHGSMAAYAADKTKVWTAGRAIGNADDPQVRQLLLAAVNPDRGWFTLAEPAAGQFGVRDGQLVDDAGRSLLPVAEIRPTGQHNVANALAAAALAGAVGVTAAEIAAGLRAFAPDAHRNQLIGARAGVRYIDDSKATNPHAAAASMQAYPRIVWIAGGQLKGADVEPLVARFAAVLAGAVLIGVDREVIRAALARHAPDLPVITVSRTDHGAMREAVAAATSLATAGDAVLLAPAAASKDMFSSFGERGLAFQDAVLALPDIERPAR